MSNYKSTQSKKATNQDCFAYNRGCCESLSVPNCHGCKFFKHKDDSDNKIKMEEFHKMNRIYDSTNRSRNLSMLDKGG